ncbi:MAG: histidine kinase [Clostridia bacterium]|jgi:anti-sigma regulatory factor (Ser/Thr protein kinase)|nr:histidine kinase [Clostridia bacterium]
MKELALHILDLAQNSITANADLVRISVDENLTQDTLTISIEDNGYGMDEKQVDKVKDPFVTSRTSRKVGLGIPLMLAACQRCEGDLRIESQKNVGTKLIATFKHSHIDRAPLGNMTDTMISLIIGAENINFVYIHIINQEEFCFDTREIRQALGEVVPLSEPDVLDWIKSYINEGLSNLRGGVL